MYRCCKPNGVAQLVLLANWYMFEYIGLVEAPVIIHNALSTLIII